MTDLEVALQSGGQIIQDEETDLQKALKAGGVLLPETSSPPPATQEKSLGQKLKRRANDFSKAFSPPVQEGRWINPSNPIVMVGSIAGGINDIIGSGISAAYDLLTPNIIKNAVKEAGDYWANTDIGKMGLSALRQGIEVYDEFRQKYPEMAKTIEASINIASVLPLAEGGTNLLKAGVQVLPKGIEEGMYGRAAKFSTTLKEGEKLKRINTALNEGIPLTKSGVAKSKSIISEINDKVQSKIAQYGEQGAAVDLENIVGKAEEMRRNKITGKSLTPEEAQGQVSGVVNEAMRNASENIPISQAQTFKQGLNKELDDFYKAMQTSPDKTLFLAKNWTIKTKAALADGLRKEISQIFPEVSVLNAKEGSLIQLNKSLERAVNRISNHDILSLKGVAAMIHSPKWFITNFILNNPTVQSSLAIAIRAARNKPLNSTASRLLPITAATVTSGIINNEQQINQGEGNYNDPFGIRGNNNNPSNEKGIELQ